MTPQQQAAIAAIEEMEAKEAQAVRPKGPMGFDLGQEDESAQLRQAFKNDVSHVYDQAMDSDFMKTIKSAGKTVYDAVKMPDEPVPVSLSSSMVPAQKNGKQRYSDGNYYAHGEKPGKPQAQPLQETEVINGVTYKLQNGKYIKVK